MSILADIEKLKNMETNEKIIAYILIAIILPIASLIVLVCVIYTALTDPEWADPVADEDLTMPSF